VVVLPPSLARQPQQMPIDPSAQHPPPELQHKLKKMSTKAWEVSFRPNEVGTHKVGHYFYMDFGILENKERNFSFFIL
jgi:hypothetical protein